MIKWLIICIRKSFFAYCILILSCQSGNETRINDWKWRNKSEKLNQLIANVCKSLQRDIEESNWRRLTRYAIVRVINVVANDRNVNHVYHYNKRTSIRFVNKLITCFRKFSETVINAEKTCPISWSILSKFINTTKASIIVRAGMQFIPFHFERS